MIGKWSGMALAGATRLGNFGGKALGWAGKNPRATMALAGAAGGGMVGGWEGAAFGAGAGALTPRGFRAFGGKQASKIMKGRGWGAAGNKAMGIAGGRLAPGFAMGMGAGLAVSAGSAAFGSIGSNLRGMNKPYSTMGSSYGASMGGAPFGSSFSGMGMRY